MNAEWMWHVVSVGELFPGNMGINVRRVQQTMEETDSVVFGHD